MGSLSVELFTVYVVNKKLAAMSAYVLAFGVLSNILLVTSPLCFQSFHGHQACLFVSTRDVCISVLLRISSSCQP